MTISRIALLVGSFVIGSVATAAAQTDSVVVGIGRQLSAEIGSEVVVPVYADLRKTPGVKLGSYTVRVTWNPLVLSYRGVDAGPFASPVERTDSVGNGILVVAGVSV